MTFPRARVAAIGVIAMCAGAAARAQSEKIALGILPPRPGSVHYEMTQDMSLEASPDGQGDVQLPATKMTVNTTMRLTQEAGAPDADGHVQVKLTYDDVKVSATLNGKPAPSGEHPLAGKALVATYSSEGRLLNMTGPEGADAMVQAVRQVIEQMTGQWSRLRLAVGETQTIPMSLALPIPIPGAAGLRMTGDSTFKLTGVDVEDGNRIASCDSVFQVALSQSIDAPAAGTAAGLTVDMKMSGSGQTRIDLDRRVIKVNEGTVTIDGGLVFARDASTTARMIVRGTMKMLFSELR